jgi:hypothetical protein
MSRSVQTNPNPDLSRLLVRLRTATADQAGQSESKHLLSLERTLQTQEPTRHPNELCAIGPEALVIYQTYITQR